MKLAIQLASGLESEDVRTVKKLAEAALAQGHQVSLFLMDDGIYAASSLQDLAPKGAAIALCATNALQRGLQPMEGVLFGGQNDWAAMVHDSDRVLHFG